MQKISIFFTADGEDDDKYFYYDKEVGSLFGFPQAYYTVDGMTDHHFHYGYFVNAAAQVAMRDPEFIQKYQNVAIGDTVSECEKAYVKLLASNGITSTDEKSTGTNEISGKIKRIGQAVIDGNSHFYLAVEEIDEVYDVSVVDYPEIVTYDVGDEITLEYSEDSPANVVLGIK